MTTPTPKHKRLFAARLSRVLACAMLAAVFMAYQNPDLILALGSRLWACF
jgi:hypothetical protein